MTAKAFLKTKKDYTVEEYLAVEQYHGERYEYYNGKIFPMPGGSIAHNRICRNILSALDHISLETESFEVFGSDQKVYLPKFEYYLYPDAIVVTESVETLENDSQAIVNPILIVEVASPSTAKYDREEKFSDYQTLPSFQEYVIVKQDIPIVFTQFREEPDLWRSNMIEGMDKSVYLRSIDVHLPMERIFRKVEFPARK
ncbi:MAG: Uma2 family endonuclease [Bacteroidota bacterium]